MGEPGAMRRNHHGRREHLRLLHDGQLARDDRAKAKPLEARDDLRPVRLLAPDGIRAADVAALGSVGGRGRRQELAAQKFGHPAIEMAAQAQRAGGPQVLGSGARLGARCHDLLRRHLQAC